ncbi:MAG: PhoH family protein [Sumerlaeia bacterium]
MAEREERVITLSQSEAMELAGARDEKLRRLQEHLEAKVVLRGNQLKIVGQSDEVERTAHVIEEILHVVRKGGRLSEQQFRSAMSYAAGRARSGLDPNGPADAPIEAPATEAARSPSASVTAAPVVAPGPEGVSKRESTLSELFLDEIPVPLKRRRLSPLTTAQKRYIQAIRKYDIVFGVGPAGTGKTYLAMAMAVGALIEGKVNRIILCRPAVEAGERLGFLPGDLAQKFDPYVRPLWDALYEMMDADKIKSAIESGVIEIAPLAYMRGRTLNNAFVILDEGQNTTIEQMKMFLTRLGFDAKAVITGDVTQVDLPRTQPSGLLHAMRVLKDIKGIEHVRFSGQDVVRHPLIMKIIQAYEHDKNGPMSSDAGEEE